AVVGGIDHNLEVVVDLLTDIAAELCGDNFLRLRIVARNSEVDCVFRIEDMHFGTLGWQLALVGFPLSEVENGLGQLPQRIVKNSIDLRRVVNSYRVRPPSDIWNYGSLRLRRKRSGR